MRIGIITQAYYPVLGGVTEHVWHLGTELQRRGHQVTIVTGGMPKRLPWAQSRQADDRGLRVLRHGVQIPIMSNGANAYLTVGWKLGRLLQRIEEEERFDIVHVQSALDPGLPLIASKAMRTPKVATYHSARKFNGAFAEYIPVVFRPVWLDAISKIQHHIAVSPAAVDFIHHYFPQINLTIIPNGVDLEHFSPTVKPWPRFRDGKLIILFVGRMDPRKGAKYLFAALPELERLIPDYRVVVVGTGWMSSYYDALIPITLRQRVEFCGYASPAELPRYYRSADVYVSPAVGNESFGIVLLEAMASGVPLVATDIDGYRQVVTSGKEGLLVPPRDPKALATAIAELAGDPEWRRQMGESGRTTVERYAWPKVVDRIEAVYGSLVGKKNHPG